MTTRRFDPWAIVPDWCDDYEEATSTWGRVGGECGAWHLWIDAPLCDREIAFGPVELRTSAELPVGAPICKWCRRDVSTAINLSLALEPVGDDPGEAFEQLQGSIRSVSEGSSAPESYVH